jgi:hypothetical protein
MLSHVVSTDMFGIDLFGYQRRRLRRWRRLSPAGKAWWGVKKLVTLVVVAVVFSGVVVFYNHPDPVLAVVEGGANPLTLVGPVVASLPLILLVVVGSLLAVFVPTRREWEHG